MSVPNDIEATVGRGCGIVGMTLKQGADFENLLPLKRATCQFIQAIDHTEA